MRKHKKGELKTKLLALHAEHPDWNGVELARELGASYGTIKNAMGRYRIRTSRSWGAYRGTPFRNTKISVTVPIAIMETLDAEAQAKNFSISKLARLLIEGGLNVR